MKKHLIILTFLITFLFWGNGRVFAQNAYPVLGNCGGPTGQSPISGVTVSWGYIYSETVFWSQLEPQRNVFNWTALDQYVSDVPDSKRVWLQVVTDWPTCGTPSTIPQWALDAGIHQFPDHPYRAPNTFCQNRPVQWDPLYLTFLEEALKAMAQRYESNPKVEAFLMMSGGNWGEMSLPYQTCFTDVKDPNNIYLKEMARVWLGDEAKSDELTGSCNGFEFCFDYYYTESVKKIIDIYARTFSKPVVLQLGNGISCRGAASDAVAKYATDTYGSKVWLKQNGWGNSTSGTYFDIFGKYKDKTRIIEEAGHMDEVCSKEIGGESCAKNTQQEAINWADYLVANSVGANGNSNAGVSAICFYDDVLKSNTSATQALQKYPIQWQPLYDGLVKNYNDFFLKLPTLAPLPTSSTPVQTSSTPVPTPTVNPNLIKVATLTFKAKENIDDVAQVYFRTDSESKVIEKNTSLDVLGQTENYSVVIGNPVITGTPPAGTPLLTAKIKFRGLSENKGDQKVKIKVVKGTLSKEYTNVNTTGDENGSYIISGFPLIGVTAGDNYSLYIKGPKHLAKGFANLTLAAGDNSFAWNTDENDFLEPGDLPIPGEGQDGVINSKDISTLLNLLSVAEPSEEELNTGDLNYDEVINGADVNELIRTLSVRYDDGFE